MNEERLSIRELLTVFAEFVGAMACGAGVIVMAGMVVTYVR